MSIQYTVLGFEADRQNMTTRSGLPGKVNVATLGEPFGENWATF